MSEHASCGGGITNSTVNGATYRTAAGASTWRKGSLTFRTQKNGFKNSTETRWRIGKHLFPVQVWADIVTRLETYPGSSDNTSMNTAWVENHKTNITSQMTHISLRSGTLYFREERLGFSHKEVVTHSLQSGFAVEPLLAIVYP